MLLLYFSDFLSVLREIQPFPVHTIQSLHHRWLDVHTDTTTRIICQYRSDTADFRCCVPVYFMVQLSWFEPRCRIRRLYYDPEYWMEPSLISTAAVELWSSAALPKWNQANCWFGYQTLKTILRRAHTCSTNKNLGTTVSLWIQKQVQQTHTQHCAFKTNPFCLSSNPGVSCSSTTHPHVLFLLLRLWNSVPETNTKISFEW